MLQDTNYVVCHYAEIGIKGKNRKFFEDALVRNIKTALSKGCFQLVKKLSGRILIELTKEAKQDNIIEVLQNVFGIAYFAFCNKVEADIEVIKNRSVEVLKEQDFKTFRVQAKRSDKTFALTSQQINEQVGAEVVSELKKGVDLTKPGITMSILGLKNNKATEKIAKLIKTANPPAITPWTKKGPRINQLDAPTKRMVSISSREL